MFNHIIRSTARASSVMRFVPRSHLEGTKRTMLMSTAASAGSAADKGPKTFKVLGLQQVAIGGPDKLKLRQLWVDMFGIPKVGDFKSEKENVDEDILRMGSGPYAVEIDIMQPLDPNKSPKVDNPPLNHIGLWVSDIHAAYKELSEKGVRFAPGGIRKGAAGFDVCFIHPKGNDAKPIGGAGVLIELVQAPPEVVKALSS